MGMGSSIQEKYKNLTADKLKEVSDERRDALNAAHQPLLNEVNAKLKEFLTPSTMTRYKQVSPWYALPFTWGARDVEKPLGLSDGQKAKIRGLFDDHLTRARSLNAILKNITDRKVAAEQRRLLTKEIDEQITKNVLAILDEGQKATWKDMLGEPFRPDRK